MAQKREKEETELKVPETVSLCAPPIPTPPKLSGNNDDSISTTARSPESSDLPETPILRESTKQSGASDARSRSRSRSDGSDGSRSLSKEEERESDDRLKRREVLRCSGCKRKVGLTGFRCRCGDLFCSEHRYSDRHDCSFDYKAAGREAIARENPVVKAAKILKV